MFMVIIGVLFVLYVMAAMLNVIGMVIGAVFSGATFILADIFSGEGIVLGIVIGLALYFWLKRRNAANAG